VRKLSVLERERRSSLRLHGIRYISTQNVLLSFVFISVNYIFRLEEEIGMMMSQKKNNGGRYLVAFLSF
jgi:hypothetical protein